MLNSRMKTSRSLAANITIALTVGLTLVMVLLGLYMNREMRREIYAFTNQKNESILELQANNASLPLWNFDTKQLQAIVDNIAKAEDIESARIVSTDNAIDVFATHNTNLDPAYNATAMKRDIVHSDGGKTIKLGHLMITPNYAEISARIEKLAIRTLLGLAVLLILLVCSVYIIAHRAIAPVTRLSAFMAASTTEAPPIERAESSVIEVKQLFDALHQMQDNYLRYQSELRAEKETAERASRVKSDFLAIMSHELRTPLNSILGLSNMFVQDTSMAAEHHEMAVIIRKASTVLLNIINDILDISKIESESLKLEKIAFDLKDVIAGVLQTLLPIASAKGLVLKSIYNQSSDRVFVIGDPLRVGRILTNLIGNAIKYTEQGSVHVTIDFTTKDDGQKEFLCIIKDTGIGIPQDKLGVIFEKFTQADESITRKYGGTGLGLAISKELITLMGGDIGVQSVLGEGSTFWFRIPFDEANDAALPSQKPSMSGKLEIVSDNTRKPIASARVLMAEDHLLNQVFMKKLLSRLGVTQLDIKENGQHAFEAFQKGGYDIILMDCHMPEMNGYDATRAIRIYETDRGGRIPIIAMTADAMVGTREKCLETGMDCYLTKPVDIDEFKRVLSQWFVFPDDQNGLKTEGAQAADIETEAPCVDISALRNYADTPDDIRTFIDVFIKQSERDIKILREQCTDGENLDWKETAHRLKGACGIAGAIAMRQLCMEAQDMLTATKAQRIQKCDQIEAAYEKAKAFFKQVHPEA